MAVNGAANGSEESDRIYEKRLLDMVRELLAPCGMAAVDHSMDSPGVSVLSQSAQGGGAESKKGVDSHKSVGCRKLEIVDDCGWVPPKNDKVTIDNGVASVEGVDVKVGGDLLAHNSMGSDTDPTTDGDTMKVEREFSQEGLDEGRESHSRRRWHKGHKKVAPVDFAERANKENARLCAFIPSLDPLLEEEEVTLPVATSDTVLRQKDQDPTALKEEAASHDQELEPIRQQCQRDMLQRRENLENVSSDQLSLESEQQKINKVVRNLQRELEESREEINKWKERFQRNKEEVSQLELDKAECEDEL